MKDKKLRLGILGLGEGRSTISAALSSPKVVLVKMCDLNLEVCKRRAKEFDFHEYTTKFEDLLNDSSIEAIAIYTPDHLHATHIMQALEHDKHVVCTKPLIDDLKDAVELIEIQKKTRKKLFVGQSSRFFQPMKRQRKDFDAGLIGDLVTVESYYNADHRWFLEKHWALEDSFKWLYGGLSHPVDFIRWYMPNIEEVMGYGMLSENGKKGGLKHYDTMQFIYKSTDGRIARVGGAYSGPVQPVQRDSEMSCILRGNLGCSQGDYMDLRYAITDKEGAERMITWEHKLKHFFRFEGKSHHAGEYENYLNYFAESVHKGFTAYPDLIEGIGTIVLLKAMERSLASGKPEKVAEIIKEYKLEDYLP